MQKVTLPSHYPGDIRCTDWYAHLAWRCWRRLDRVIRKVPQLRLATPFSSQATKQVSKLRSAIRIEACSSTTSSTIAAGDRKSPNELSSTQKAYRRKLTTPETTT